MTEIIDLFSYDPRTIVKAEVRDQGADFYMMFDDGTAMVVKDVARYCCEDRYIDTDDDPEDLVGGRLQGIILKNVGGGDCDRADGDRDSKNATDGSS